MNNYIYTYIYLMRYEQFPRKKICTVVAGILILFINFSSQYNQQQSGNLITLINLGTASHIFSLRTNITCLLCIVTQDHMMVRAENSIVRIKFKQLVLQKEYQLIFIFRKFSSQRGLKLTVLSQYYIFMLLQSHSLDIRQIRKIKKAKIVNLTPRAIWISQKAETREVKRILWNKNC